MSRRQERPCRFTTRRVPGLLQFGRLHPDVRPALELQSAARLAGRAVYVSVREKQVVSVFHDCKSAAVVVIKLMR